MEDLCEQLQNVKDVNRVLREQGRKYLEERDAAQADLAKARTRATELERALSKRPKSNAKQIRDLERRVRQLEVANTMLEAQAADREATARRARELEGQVLERDDALDQLTRSLASVRRDKAIVEAEMLRHDGLVVKQHAMLQDAQLAQAALLSQLAKFKDKL